MEDIGSIECCSDHTYMLFTEPSFDRMERKTEVEVDRSVNGVPIAGGPSFYNKTDVTVFCRPICIQELHRYRKTYVRRLKRIFLRHIHGVDAVRVRPIIVDQGAIPDRIRPQVL